MLRESKEGYHLQLWYLSLILLRKNSFFEKKLFLEEDIKFKEKDKMLLKCFRSKKMKFGWQSNFIYLKDGIY
jgi:hypothetical protein